LLLAPALLAGEIAAQDHRHDNQEAIAKLATALGLRPGSVMADVGAGDGAYAVPLAKTVGPAGRVVAVDISKRAIERLRARIDREGLTNVTVVHGDVDNPKLDPASLDAVLIVNAYHEMTEYASMLRHIRAALKPEGRLVIADFASPSRRSDPRDAQTRRHEIAPELVLEEVHAAGFKIIGLEDPFNAGHGHAEHVGWLLTLTPSVAQVPDTGHQIPGARAEHLAARQYSGVFGVAIHAY
jgi:ubiquinone/menaquinone biosynthesis C-methylase UbiE